MRSLAMLSASTPVVATAAAANSASRPRALVAPAQLPRRPVVAAAFAVAAAAGAERRGVVVSVAAAPSSRRSVRVSVSSVRESQCRCRCSDVCEERGRAREIPKCGNSDARKHLCWPKCHGNKTTQPLFFPPQLSLFPLSPGHQR